MGSSAYSSSQSIGSLDLSRLKVLRSLQFRGWVADPSPEDGHPFSLIELFSAIRSPVFSELVIVIEGRSVNYLPLKVKLFETLRDMHKVRPFKLVFLLDTLDSHERVRWELERTLGLLTTNGVFGFLDSPPTIRTVQDRYSGWDSLNFA